MENPRDGYCVFAFRQNDVEITDNRSYICRAL